MRRFQFLLWAPLLFVFALAPPAAASEPASAPEAAPREPAAAGEPRAPVEIREWAVPWPGTRPRDPVAESADSVWFVGQTGHYLGHLDVETGRFAKIDLEDEPGPHNVVVDEHGVLWYAGNFRGYIGRVEPSRSGGAPSIEKIAMPDPAAADPHTLVFAPDGRLWFTVQGGNFVGRLDPESRKVDLVPVPTENARPYGIAVAPDGRVWVALFGTNELASLDPETLEISLHPLPRPGARARRLGVSSDGRVWYGDYAEGRLGAYDPAAARFEEWPLPSGPEARPYAMAIDARDRVWLVETGPQPNRLVGFDPRDASFLGAAEIPSGAGSVRHMDFHAPSRSLWFGTDANTIGRARLEPTPGRGSDAGDSVPRRAGPRSAAPDGAAQDHAGHSHDGPVGYFENPAASSVSERPNATAKSVSRSRR